MRIAVDVRCFKITENGTVLEAVLADGAEVTLIADPAPKSIS